jgi:adenylate cyclase
VPFFQTAEQRVYDLFLHVKPPIPEREEILLLDIDDTAISNVGLYPWSRDYMARGLIALREFDVSYVTFDIEYVESSPQGVDGRFLSSELPEIFDASFASMVDQVNALFGALAAGQIPLADAPDFVQQWADYVSALEDDLVSTVGSVVEDNDAFLGQAADFHGSTFFTVNILDYDELAPTAGQSPVEKTWLTDIAVEDERGIRPGEDIRPAIAPVLSGGRSAGFPNVVVDPDGVRRRIDLVAGVEDNYYAQLVMAPLLDWLGNPAVVVRRNSVDLEGALLPGSETAQTVSIPLATDGRMLINWPKAEYEESFRHISYWRLIFDWEKEEEMVELLRAISPNLERYFANPDALLPLYDFAESLKADVLAGGDRAQIDDWREYRSMFFEALGEFVGSDVLDFFLADLQAAIDSGQYDESVIPQLEAIGSETSNLFGALSERYEQFRENRDVLLDELPGSFIIIGLVGTSTTDIGVTPFDEEYMNVGTHASVVNTILQQSFLDDVHWLLSLALMFVLAVIVTLVISGLEPTPSIIIGFGALVVLIGGVIALFLFTGIYVNLVTPVAGVLLTFITLTIIKFINTNQEKKFIRNAFNHYLATDVINEILEDPEMLGLGGKRKHITAVFTDVRKFSTISERLDPERLVKLLNRYLTGMSDVVLNERGLIDKFEGDAIIAMFGAPKVVEPHVHAMAACRAAVAMKKLEKELNVAFLQEGFLTEDMNPNQLLTRVGINSGEAVVGNMGTETRMDYTMMGNTVNLAARLEGVNKQFNTWTLISQSTYDAIKGDADYQKQFTVRKLSKVMVVGINEPVRIYELIDTYEGGDQNQDLVEKLKVFNCGLTAFEVQEWGEAERCFLQVRDEFGESEEEGPVGFYLKRIDQFKKRGPGKNWAGEFQLSEK